LKTFNKSWLVALALCLDAGRAAADAPAELAEVSARNIAMLSSALAAHQQGMNDIATTRTAHIVSVNRLAINAKQESDREVEILKQTGGAAILDIVDALRAHGDRAALARGEAEAAEAAVKADISAAYTPLAIATDKLDRAAETLAALGRQQTPRDRAKFLVQFAKDVRDESAKLSKASDDKKADADQKLSNTVAAASAAATSHK
jgi:hypothetical protein